MKTLLTFTFILFVLFSGAQTWCAPGAEWHLNRLYIAGPSYAKITYAGTVTVNGKTCQQLDYMRVSFDYPNGPTYTQTLAPYYSTYSNSVVYLLNKTTNVFDTLYHFDAVPGDKWLLPASYTYTLFPYCNRNVLTVIDTGHKVIQGVNLKWLKSTISFGSGTVNDTIFERMGFLTYYFLQHDFCTMQLDYNEGGSLRCYSDIHVGNYNRSNNACNYLYTPTLIRKIGLDNNFSLFPNPAADKINIKLNSQGLMGKSCMFRIVDVSGRTVLSKEFVLSEKPMELLVGDLKKGIYFLNIASGSYTEVKKLVIE